MPSTQIILLKISLMKNANPQSDSNSSYKYENITTKKLTTQRKKTEEENNKNGMKHSWIKGTCVLIGDSMLAGIDERKMSTKRLIKVRTFPGPTCSDMDHHLVPILEKKSNYVILHVRTNDVAHYEGMEIISKLLKLKSFIAEQLQCSYISNNHEN